MDEIWVRLVTVSSLGTAAAVISRVVGRDRRGLPRRVKAGVLAPGIYLFTSSTCQDCLTARAALDRALGSDGYQAMEWEAEPDVFDELAVEAVPATVVVARSGRAKLFPGQPDRALRSFNP